MQSLQSGVQIKPHHGSLAVFEERPIRLAVIPANKQPLVESIMVRPVPVDRTKVRFDINNTIIVHPRYVKPGLQYEIMEVYGYRNGRTIDILLDEPLVIAGQTYGILNIKGVGANADREMLFNPEKWYIVSALIAQKDSHPQILWRWVPIEKADAIERRTWGAMHRKGAIHEFDNLVLQENGIPQYPHLTINHMPLGLNQHIMESEHGTQYKELSQITRAFSTNIRLGSGFIDPDRIAAHIISNFTVPDIAVINAQLRLTKKGKMIVGRGPISENRFINGTFTDSGNFKLEDYDPESVAYFVKRVLWDSISPLLTVDMLYLEAYLQTLEGATKLPFTKVQTDNPSQELELLLKEALGNSTN